MAPDEKLDLLLRKMEENEKKRVAAEERSRADLAQLKSAVEARLPQVEKRVDDIASVVNTLSHKVEQLEGTLQKFGDDDKKPKEVKEEHLATPKGESSFQIQGSSVEDATCEDKEELQSCFPQAPASGQVGSPGREDVRARQATRHQAVEEGDPEDDQGSDKAKDDAQEEGGK